LWSDSGGKEVESAERIGLQEETADVPDFDVPGEADVEWEIFDEVDENVCSPTISTTPRAAVTLSCQRPASIPSQEETLMNPAPGSPWRVGAQGKTPQSTAERRSDG
jgi:hypothetical protein